MATDNSIRCIMVYDSFTDVEKKLRGRRECNILNNNVDNAELLRRILDDYYRVIEQRVQQEKQRKSERVLCR